MITRTNRYWKGDGWEMAELQELIPVGGDTISGNRHCDLKITANPTLLQTLGGDWAGQLVDGELLVKGIKGKFLVIGIFGNRDGSPGTIELRSCGRVIGPKDHLVSIAPDAPEA